MQKSLWQETYSKGNIHSKSIPKKTDICIIGGGITGLSTAYFLKESDFDITLIEQGNLFQGVTSKTTAKISFLQQDIYQKLEKMKGFSISQKYYQSQKEAIELLVNTIKQNQINCDLEKTPSILFTTQQENISKVKKEKDILERFHEKTIEVSLPKVAYAFKVDGTYTFHPLKYLNKLVTCLSKKTSIYEKTKAYQIDSKENGYLIHTNRGLIEATYIVIACHYPFFIFPMVMPFKTYLKREYVYAAPIKNKSLFTAINLDNNLHSIRFYKDFIIYGCKEHLLTDLTTSRNAFEMGKKEFMKIFKEKPLFSWINQDIYSHDFLPFIGEVGKDKHLFIGTAYGAWGMTNGTLAGKIIADKILGKENTYHSLFNPKRMSLSFFISSCIGSIPYVKGYLGPLFSKEKPVKVQIDGKSYYVTVSSKGEKQLVKTLCPHMLCPLVWNASDKTWDCPCHGSRFYQNGDLYSGPSKKNITKEE